MHQVQIKIIGPEISQSLVQSRQNIIGSMLGVPQFAGNEDLVAWHTRLLDTGANLGFIAVNGSAVYVTVTLLKGDFNSILDLQRLGLPSTEAHGGNLCACVEGEMRFNGHDE